MPLFQRSGKAGHKERIEPEESGFGQQIGLAVEVTTFRIPFQHLVMLDRSSWNEHGIQRSRRHHLFIQRRRIRFGLGRLSRPPLLKKKNRKLRYCVTSCGGPIPTCVTYLECRASIDDDEEDGQENLGPCGDQLDGHRTGSDIIRTEVMPANKVENGLAQPIRTGP